MVSRPVILRLQRSFQCGLRNTRGALSVPGSFSEGCSASPQEAQFDRPSHGVRLARGGRQTGGHGTRRRPNEPKWSTDP